MIRCAVLIDGGFLREHAKKKKCRYNPDLIEKFAAACTHDDERAIRILYYDCPPYEGTVKWPISGIEQEYKRDGDFLPALAKRDLFAVRRGQLKFRGFKPKKPINDGQPQRDEDFKPDFHQKGVDMRIGLDIATFSERRSVERIILVSGDTDCVPALKHARIAGLQTVLVRFSGERISWDLMSHADFTRDVSLSGAT